MESQNLLCQVLLAAAEFNERQLWKRWTNADCFAIHVPARKESFLAVIMGAGGEEYGISLFRGPAPYDYIAAMHAAEGPGDDALAEIDLLGFSMDRFADLPPESQDRFRQVGLHPRHDQRVPNLMAKATGRRVCMPQAADLELLLCVLRGLMAADRQGLLKPTKFDDACGICTLTLEGALDAVQVRATRVPWPKSEANFRFPVEAAELSGLPRLDVTWLAGLLPMPTGVAGDDREPLLLLVVEAGAGEASAGEGESEEARAAATGRVLHALPVMPDDFGQAVGGMVDILCGRGPLHEKGLPREIRFSSRRLWAAMTGMLASRAVRCVYQPQLPALRQIAMDFFEHMERAVAADTRQRRRRSVADLPVPAPDDLQGWKKADQELAGRFADYLAKPALWSSRAAQQYFGAPDLRRYFAAHEQRAVIQAYAAWGALCYRPGKSSQTHTEKLLAKGLPEAQRLLLEARLASYPSLYRVAKHDPKAGTIDLEDVLRGGKAIVYDRMMSENIDDGLFLCARVFPAGQFHFLDPAGPPLGAGMGTEAVEFLRAAGLESTPDGLRCGAHLFGRLWDWSDDWGERFQSMRLANMDGDELLWHTASFEVADVAAIRKALLARADIEQEEGDEFLWIQKTGRAAQTMGGPVHLGRIELIGDELVLTVNSEKRYAKGRQWLEILPGVRFRNVTTRRWNEQAKDRPLDERIAKPEPIEITPDLAQALQELLTKQYMTWLDTPLPVLGSQTPRQACQTPAGRQQVTTLIRTMPDPMGPAPVHAPRQAMLQALGLEAGGASPMAGPPPSLSTRPTPSPPSFGSGEVGRNEPCPCGSGKKYKQCCGR